MAHRHSLGILGGGQLGRMMLQSAVDFDLDIRVLDPDPSAPCAAFSPDFTQGDFNDEQTVLNWAKGLDRLTLEIEHVSASALEKLEERGVVVSPSSQVVRLVQDKRAQKRFYRDNGFPTSDFVEVAGKAEIEQRLAQGGDWVFKTAQAGYDGKGVFVLGGDLSQVPDVPGLLEKAVDIEKELAVLVARGADGEITVYDPVEMVFDPKLNLVDHLIAPAAIAPEWTDRATALARNVASAMGVVGLLAVELFLTPQGELLINEVAPRPHNSGHHTIHACETSQFEQHLRAVMGWPLGSPRTLVPAAMINLLGAEGHEGRARYEGFSEVLAIEGAHVVLYGKKHTKPGRKMGHVTLTGTDLGKLRENVEVVRRTLRVVSQ